MLNEGVAPDPAGWKTGNMFSMRAVPVDAIDIGLFEHPSLRLLVVSDHAGVVRPVIRNGAAACIIEAAIIRKEVLFLIGTSRIG
jgi:hypothetical protein